MAYGTFAKYYDAAMGDRTQDLAYIKGLIKKHKPEGKSILDLGCATGSVLQAFAETHKVTGVDTSPEMLAIAKEKVPSATLINADMTMFSGSGQFDIVLCVFDAINHLMTMGQWKQLFTSASQNLAPDGVFIFDINTLHKLQKFSVGEMLGHEFDGNYYMTKVTKGDDNVFDWAIKVFEKEPSNEYLLHEEHIAETSFPIDQVKEMVESVFLGYAKSEDPFLGSVSDQSNRVVFICR